MVAFSDISVVVQGPLHISEDDPRGSKLTQRCIQSVRDQLPGAKVIVSTWAGMDASGLDADDVVYSDDPGPTVTKFNTKDQPHKVNINRQIVCTVAGLKRVTTPFAIKLRSDNVLTSNKFVRHYYNFATSSRSQEFSYFRSRVVASNFFAKEYSQGKAIPFFPSDFFHFGRTEDLMALWDLPMFSDYRFRPELSGKRQHDNYPFHQLHVEQMLWLGFINKHRHVELAHKFDDDHGEPDLSHKILCNNLIVLDEQELGLVVPKRLEQNSGFPFTHFTFERWQTLYQRYCAHAYPIPHKHRKALIHTATRVAAYALQGIKQDVKLAAAKSSVALPKFTRIKEG